MKRTITGSLLLALVLTLVLVALAATGQPALAQAEDLCFAVADRSEATGSRDALVSLNRVTGVTTLIGRPGTSNVEAIAFEPGGETLYAANEDVLGTLNLLTGAFTEKANVFGSGSGTEGTIEFIDVDGLSVDPTTGILYGTHRRDQPERDVLIQIDKSTGAHVSGAFGGDDYVVITGPDVLPDIDDIAVDPLTGEMFATSNTGGDGGVLISVDKATGASTVVGEFGIDDIEGLAFFNDGQLYGSTGKDGRFPETRNSLFQINETSGAASLVAPFSEFADYEALGCLTASGTNITLSGVEVSGTDNAALAIGLFLTLTTLAGLSVLFIWRSKTAPVAEPMKE